MSEDAQKQAVLRWYEAVSQGDLSRLERLADEIFSPDFVEHDPRMPDIQPGPAGVKEFIRQVRNEYPDVQARVHDIFSCGDRTAYRCTLTLTEAASGRQVTLQVLAIARFENGKIAEEWELGVPGQW